MRVIITKKEEITSKGKEYVVYKGISESGKTVDIFLSKQDANRYDIPDSVIADPASIKQLFSAETAVLANFDERGRLDTLTVEE